VRLHAERSGRQRIARRRAAVLPLLPAAAPLLALSARRCQPRSHNSWR